MRNPSFKQAAREFLDRLSDRSRQAAPQSFSVRCDCGHILRGERTEGFQALDCPECGQKVFALARNPRPAPKFLRGRRQQEAEHKSSPEPDSPPASDQPRAGMPEVEAQPESPIATRREHVAEKSLEPELAPPASQRRRLSLPYLATLGVCLLLLLTGWGTWRQRQIRIYSAQLESATDEGLRLLKQADFVRAAERLGQADRAARGLGGESPRERLAVQLHREAQLWMHLAREPLERFFAQVDAAGADDIASWNERFVRDCGRRTLIFDAWVSPPAETESYANGETVRPPHRAEWVIVAQGLRVELSLAGLRLFDELKLNEPRRLIFGAMPSGLRRSDDDPGLWLVELAPDSGALITVAEPLRYYGWPEDVSLPGVLQSQREMLGIK